MGIIDKITKCNLIEIYDKRTNDVIIKFVANKRESIINQVVKAMRKCGFRVFVQGSTYPESSDLHWIASNKDYSCLYLAYHQKEIDRKDLTFDSKGYCYTTYNKRLIELNKNKERDDR